MSTYGDNTFKQRMLDEFGFYKHHKMTKPQAIAEFAEVLAYLCGDISISKADYDTIKQEAFEKAKADLISRIKA